MSLLDRFDATNLCVRASTDPSAWATPAPEPVRRPSAAAAHSFSWLAFARNPRAAVITGFAGPLLAADAVARSVLRARAA